MSMAISFQILWQPQAFSFVISQVKYLGRGEVDSCWATRCAGKTDKRLEGSNSLTVSIAWINLKGVLIVEALESLSMILGLLYH